MGRLIALPAAIALLIVHTYGAQTKTAAIQVNCTSFALESTSQIVAGVGTIYLNFTSFDGQSGFPQVQVVDSVTVLVSQEISPSGDPGIYLTDYFSVLGTEVATYGSGRLTIPVIDNDQNDFPDFLQLNQSVNARFNGTVSADWPTPQTGTISGQLLRFEGSQSGTYSVTVEDSPPITYAGIWHVGHGSGAVTYQRGNADLMSVDMRVWSGSSEPEQINSTASFRVVNADTIEVEQSTTVGGPGVIVIQPYTLTRKGNTYSGFLTLNDGSLQTSWKDYVGWFVSIVDSNDEDGDHVPDFSDTPANKSPSVTLSDFPTVIAEGRSIQLEAVASDEDGSIASVEFFDGTHKLGSSNSNPYGMQIETLSIGIHTLTAVALDNDNARATSSVRTVHVIEPPKMSQPALTLPEVRVSASATVGLAHVLETSSNARDWMPIATNRPTRSIQVLSTPQNGVRQFYRLLVR